MTIILDLWEQGKTPDTQAEYNTQRRSPNALKPVGGVSMIDLVIVGPHSTVHYVGRIIWKLL